MTIALVEEFGVGAGNRPLSTDPICPHCGLSFTPRRRNQRYCVPPCQKKASRNTARGSQKTADNPEARRRAEGENRRAMLLLDELFRKTPAQRPAFMETILAAACEHDWHLRRILTDYDALHGFKGRPNIARTMDDYCTRTRSGARIWQVVAKGWSDDATTIRPLAIYRGLWANADPELEGPPEVHVQRDPKLFLDQLRAARGVLVGCHKNPPSCYIKGDLLSLSVVA